MPRRKYKKKLKFWVVTVDMGYGHQRAAYPLKHLAYQGIINANTYTGIPATDRKIWQEQRKFYETISRFKSFPLIGDAIFKLYDRFQRIPKFYPKRDLSKPNFQVLAATRLIKDKHWGRHLIKKLAKKPLPLVTPFFATAIMAEVNNYPNEIYCVICDADISRSWVAAEPKQSRIKYFAPCDRVVERLKLYGVLESRIFLTGFPLPLKNLGSRSLGIAKFDLRHRLINLDPQRNYINKYKDTLHASLKIKNFPKKADHPLTLTFAVGGAGAQRELGIQIVKGLIKQIENRKIRVNLIAGVNRQVSHYFRQSIIKIGLQKQLHKEVRILYTPNKEEYLEKFNEWIRKTDILWTKPSELSFYCALGLPIIMAPPIGSQEDFNQKFLISLGAGILQNDLRYVSQWLFDWINNGRLAEAAAQGFLEAPQDGVYNIEKIILKNLDKFKSF
ncbi:hypothetical protein KKF32_02855 [Patescibacteria group bacterium]|nr:hypothetical protein [Patescibacteria group bacterium]